MGLQFGIFDHIEPVPGLSLHQIYRERLLKLEQYDAAGFYAYHLAEHHTPAVHSLAPSQNVFLAAASQCTQRLRLAPCVYVLPLHHPLRLIEEVCMLDHLSDGRLELGVGRGGVLEAHFWGSDADVERNFVKYQETLDILRQGLSHEDLTYQGEFYTVPAGRQDPRPVQQPGPPVLLGGMSRPAMERAGRIAEGWIASSRADLTKISEAVRVIGDAAAAAGRDPDAVRIICRGVVLAGIEGSEAKGPDGRRRLLSGSYEQIREDAAWLAGEGVTELFYDLNWDPQVGNPAVAPGDAAERAGEILAGLAPR